MGVWFKRPLGSGCVDCGSDPCDDGGGGGGEGDWYCVTVSTWPCSNGGCTGSPSGTYYYCTDTRPDTSGCFNHCGEQYQEDQRYYYQLATTRFGSQADCELWCGYFGAPP
jgi:hypothetical protein